MNRTISFDTLFSEIESAGFYAKIFLINSLESFLFFLQANDSVNELLNLVRIDETRFSLIKDRILRIYKYQSDKNKLHPYDHSIAIYLYVIFMSFREKTIDVLRYIYENQLPNLWWTYILYNHVLRQFSVESANTCQTQEIAIGITADSSIDYINITHSFDSWQS